MDSKKIQELLPTLGRVKVPITEFDSGKQMVGWLYAASVGGKVFEGKVTVQVDSTPMVASAFSNTEEAVDTLFAQLPSNVPTSAVAGKTIVETVPAKTKPAAPASPPAESSPDESPAETAPTPAPRRRGRPPGSKNASPPPPPQEEDRGFTPDSTDAPDGEPGGEPSEEPGEPTATSGRTLSELMGYQFSVGQAGGVINGKSSTEIAASVGPTSKTNLDDILYWITTYRFTPGALCPTDPEELKENVSVAFDLIELRKKLGLYKPLNPKAK